MDENEVENKRLLNVTFGEDSRSAVNSLILDYYQKFGRKRDLEQFFALSTTQSNIRDPTSLFWRKMKVQSDSSDSGEGKAGSSTELCRISIKCTVPEQSTSQDDNPQSKDDSVSPPIITEEAISSLHTDQGTPTQSDNESMKSDDNNSQKSTEPHLETSINKPFSPTSSITSQRKLEWDSLGDVGYGNESERKISGSNLSTLERLALQQQYSNNDSKHDTPFGPPTSQSTPVETNISQKGKKGSIKKITKFYKKDVDLVELNVPHTSENTQLINVNLTKHISFNVDKNGDFSVMNSKEDIRYSTDKVSVETEMTPQVRLDKEIQTSFTQSIQHKDKCTNPIETQRNDEYVCEQRFPIILNLNTLKKRKRRRKLRVFRKKLNKQKSNLSNLHSKKSVNQISEAESFEYMPGYIYNQNQRKTSYGKDSNSVGNKSSLESSMVFTTDSSKVNKNSFSKDLEKSINLLKDALHPKYSNSKLKEKLIKEVVQRLLKAKYSDDDCGNVFLSSLSFNRKNFNNSQSNNHTTTSTSDDINFTNSNIKRPKKSILRTDKFNPNGMASTSQSTPNLHSLAQNEQQVNVHKTLTISNTESDSSSKGRNSSDTVPKMSSEELYKKYLDALNREQIHKKLLKDKETLFKKKLISSDTCIKATPARTEQTENRLYRLIKELAQNNMDNGSGDASKVEGRSNSDQDQYSFIRTQRNHSVFTLASGKSVPHSRHSSPKKFQSDKKQSPEAGSSKLKDNCCTCSQRSDYTKLAECPLHNVGCKEVTDLQRHNYCKHNKEDNSDFTVGFLRSNKTSPRTTEKTVHNADNVQYVCLCPEEAMDEKVVPEKLLIYKCSRVSQQPVSLDSQSKASSSIGVQCSSECICSKQRKEIKPPMSILPDNTTCINNELIHMQSSSTLMCPSRKASVSSQTHANLDQLLQRDSCCNSESTTTSKKTCQPVIMENICILDNQSEYKTSECNSCTYDVTRSIQTKICIDPKISNPSISDVVFINDADCVKILGGHKTDISTIEKNAECHYGDFKNQELNKCIKNKTVPIVHQHQTEMNVKRANDVSSKFTEKPIKHFPNENKFSIPIHGTNMTLIVSLGSDIQNSTDVKNVTAKEKCITTNKINPISKEIMCNVDSSKGVQCTNTDFVSLINENIDESISDINKNFKLAHESQSTNMSTEDSKYNTYPTKSQGTKRSFVRSNTCTGCLESSVTKTQIDKKLNVETQKDFPFDLLTKTKESIDYFNSHKSLNDNNNTCKRINVFRNDQERKSKTSSTESKGDIKNSCNDPILNIIQDITKRYTKNDMEKSKRKKCFRDIITVLNYLLDTEESSDQKEGCSSSCNTDGTSLTNQSNEKKTTSTKKNYVDKAVQLSVKKDKKLKSCTESSYVPSSSDKPPTTDSGTCKVLNKIKRECEKYHQKRCKIQCDHKKCDDTSSTSVNCENCNRVHYCSFKPKYKANKTKSNLDKGKKKCVAYNLIIQTSDGVTSEDTVANEGCGRKLKNVIVKVPSKHGNLSNAPCKEVSANIEKRKPNYSLCCEDKVHRSKSLPNDSERSSDDLGKTMRTCTVRDYLEINRPDFIEKTMERQNCMKVIKQTRPGEVCGTSGVKMIVVHTPQCTRTTCMDPCNIYCSGTPINCNACVNPLIQSFNNEVTRIGETSERAAKRRLLSQQLERQQTLNTLNSQELQHLAKELGAQLRRKKVLPKFISEREMKKHSEKIYKSLPEVVQKKEQLKKENMKKTNLLMANIFKKNLQMKTLRGSINLSNYSTVVKI